MWPSQTGREKGGGGKVKGKGEATGPAGRGEKRTKTSLTLGSLTCCMKEGRPCLVHMVLAQLAYD